MAVEVGEMNGITVGDSWPSLSDRAAYINGAEYVIDGGSVRGV